MYVNQIDNIIDQILDKLYLEGISNDPTFQKIINEQKLNFVEYQEQINNFIQNFVNSIDTNQIQKLIVNKENLNRIMDIIKRYVAYYYYLSLAYYYAGTIKEYRNALIQYSKLQEQSTFNIRNFFDTENNYQLIHFFKIIKDFARIIVMTPLQRKTLNPLDIKGAIDLYNELGKEYIDTYLLQIVKENEVEVNVHNLIKTIVFREIYMNQEQRTVFAILNEAEEADQEYTYIDIVVDSNYENDFENFKQIFAGYPNEDILARDLFELVIENNRIFNARTLEQKINDLLKFKFITPIVDDFLRYHRDTEKLETANQKEFIAPLLSKNNGKNVQLALLYQQRKKKENTKAQLIINKIDAIAELYSLRDNPDLLAKVRSYFYAPMASRKATLHNNLEETYVLRKIIDQGDIAMQGNEYFLELKQAIRRAYFNFKNFKKYGMMLNLENTNTSGNTQPLGTLNLLRYSNIEYQKLQSNLEIDVHTGVEENTIALVGLALGPFDNSPIQCVKKNELIDIRSNGIKFPSDPDLDTTNGYDRFIRLMKDLVVDNIRVRFEPKFELYFDLDTIRKSNPNLTDKIIYWIYDVETDHFQADTYENVKSYNFQEKISMMNGKVYDDIIEMLNAKLIELVNTHSDLSAYRMEILVSLFNIFNQLSIGPQQQNELIIREYLHKKKLNPSRITNVPSNETEIIPEFVIPEDRDIFTMDIDVINPLNPRKFRRIDIHSKKPIDSILGNTNTKCEHEHTWKTLGQFKKDGLNKFNSAVSQFISKYAVKTLELDFVCRICGQLLDLKQYVQDGKFNNDTQQFITAYTPLNIPLEDFKEYKKYTTAIRILEGQVKRISLITDTNMYTGLSTDAKKKRTSLIKNIIDIFLLHNEINMKKNISDQERSEYFSRKFNIDKDYDSIFFFELEDSIFENSSLLDTQDSKTSINRLKLNNIWLYFLLIFMTELNGSQIVSMYSDKFANIYTFEYTVMKYGAKLFGDLLIKKNINDVETVPLTDYPVLCYLLFVLSYLLIKYNIWYYPSTRKKTFNPVVQKIIITSMVDLINSIALDAGTHSNNYIYMLTTGKIYSQMNHTFRNEEIINLLKENHRRYKTYGKGRDDVAIKPPIEEIAIRSYSINNPFVYKLKPYHRLSFKTSQGIQFMRAGAILYLRTITVTDISNCPVGKSAGAYHQWKTSGTILVCEKCGMESTQVEGNVFLLNEAYYYGLSKLAQRRCVTGQFHKFENVNGQTVCKICGRTPNATYTVEELNELAESMKRLEAARIDRALNLISREKSALEKIENIRQDRMTELVNSYEKSHGKSFVETSVLIKNFMDSLVKFLGSNVNLDLDKFPVYLEEDVYIIDHSYKDAPFTEPIILTESSGKVKFKEDDSFFKRDVYFYTDSRSTPVDVFYNAVNMRLLGYKEKHKDYVLVEKSSNYLRINRSIQNRLISLGYPTQYIDIAGMFIKNQEVISDANQNLHQIMDNLIKEHITMTKTTVDKFISILYKIKNFNPEEDESDLRYLRNYQLLEQIVTKYGNLIKNLNLGPNDNIFDDWNKLRDQFVYQQVDWSKTNIIATDNMFVNIETINYYDTTSHQMIYYLMNKLTEILSLNPEKIVKINISQMFVNIIDYIYNLSNRDSYRHNLQLKRFEYIINGSNVMIDLVKRGQGLQFERDIEELQDEQDLEGELEEGDETNDPQDALEDIREEADALDVEEVGEDEGAYEIDD